MLGQKTKEKQMSLSGSDLNVRRLGILLAAIIIMACVVKPGIFFRLATFQSIGSQLSEYGLMALGGGLAMISGGIDISSVYIANLCGISAALCMQRLAGAAGEPAAAAILAGIIFALALGLGCGALNGFLIAKIKIPAMLATLGTYQLYLGIAIILSKGSTVQCPTRKIGFLGNAKLFGLIPVPFAIFIIAAVFLDFLMRKTKLGAEIMFVGANKKASLFSGIKVSSVIIRTYMLSGLTASIAGIISLSKLNSAKADFGSSYTMQCILIVVLGGVSPNGGIGNVVGIAIAVIILQTLSTLLNMFPDISNFYRDLIWGAALIVVLIFNYFINKSKRDQG